ncbi:hypothetical protein TNCT_695431 [Trichonephila clavata]|uniref:Uncharacterized protein n=1 Tax=Trichonephila clavata TaxID=2740835 RepID=A0A8X6FTV8_TRICU|nr:hypothetical protein TNCT_695431 [Trichonephila clavata]
MLYNALDSDESSRNSFRIIEASPVVRKNETPQPPRNYGNIGIKKGDSPNDSEPTLYKSRSQTVGDYPIFNEYIMTISSTMAYPVFHTIHLIRKATHTLCPFMD